MIVGSRQELHRRYLFDITYEVSTTPTWRRALFAGGGGATFRVDAVTSRTLPRWLRRVLRRHRLAYDVTCVAQADTEGWEGYEGCIIFRFEAAEFPDIVTTSANNPDSI
jgi:hypothetical protein